MGNTFMPWYNPDEPEQQHFMQFSDTPPPPIPQCDELLAEAVAQMHRTAAEAYARAWGTWPSLPKTEPIPFDPARMGRDTARAIRAAQEHANIIIVDGLPLMGNPYAPEYRWHREASELIYAARDAAPLPVKMRLHRLCTRYPQRVCLSLAVAYPQRDAKWARVTSWQVLPILADLVVKTLQLPAACVTTVDHDFTEFLPTLGAPRWRMEVYEADEVDELEATA